MKLHAIINIFFPFFLSCSCSKIEDVYYENKMWTKRAEEITTGCSSDYEKAKAIYKWECANIEYDLTYSIYTAEGCWDNKKGVCQAYSELFVLLASHCNIEAKIVSGNCRTHTCPEGDGRHAWVKVNTEKGWILVDPTWGAGFVSIGTGEFVFYENNMSWFDANPQLVVFTHFPSDSRDQLLSTPVTRSQYEMLPLIEPIVEQAGWKGENLLNYFLFHLGETAPTFYVGFQESANSIELVEMPYCGILKRGWCYTMRIKNLNLDIELPISSSNANNWIQEDDLYTLIYEPGEEDNLTIYLNHRGIMSYVVID